LFAFIALLITGQNVDVYSKDWQIKSIKRCMDECLNTCVHANTFQIPPYSSGFLMVTRFCICLSLYVFNYKKITLKHLSMICDSRLRMVKIIR